MEQNIGMDCTDYGQYHCKTMVGVEYDRTMGHTNSEGQALYVIQVLDANNEAMYGSKRIEMVVTDSSKWTIEESKEEK
jgi:hypothetical protein